MTKASISISSLSTKDGKADFLRKAFRRMNCGSSGTCTHISQDNTVPAKKSGGGWESAS